MMGYAWHFEVCYCKYGGESTPSYRILLPDSLSASHGDGLVL
jgi:hypothetical protein